MGFSHRTSLEAKKNTLVLQYTVNMYKKNQDIEYSTTARPLDGLAGRGRKEGSSVVGLEFGKKFMQWIGQLKQ